MMVAKEKDADFKDDEALGFNPCGSGPEPIGPRKDKDEGRETDRFADDELDT